MQKRSIDEVMTELRAWWSHAELSHEELAIRAGVNLSSVYRVFAEDSTRKQYGPALRAICKFAKIRIDIGESPGGEVPEVVRAAVMRTWDGSEEHARRLAVAISGVGDLIRQALSSK